MCDACMIIHACLSMGFRDLSCDLAGGLLYTKWPLDVRRLLDLLLNVMFVVALRQNTKDLLVHFNLFLFQSGNGTKSVWTSSPGFQKPRKEMMPPSLSLTDFPKLLTSFPFASL